MDARATRFLVLVSLLSFLVAGQPSPAAGEAGSRLAPDLTLLRIGDARPGLSSGRIAPALEAAASLGGIHPERPPGEPPILSLGAPAPVARPVARLLTAALHAGEVARRAIGPDPERALAAIRAAAGLHAPPGASRLPALPPVVRQALETLDRPALYGAALHLAEAVDAAIPELRAAASGVPASGEAECDVYQISDVLCVGGSGANTYPRDFLIQVDLGGDDLYQNAAGGIEFGASVLLDLGGNDRYEAVVPAVGMDVAQGSALLGIGMLVDAGGDDRYEATNAPSPFAEFDLRAQAYSAFGVGVLADHAGNDVYRMTGRGPVSVARVRGQSFADVGGMSLVLDGGGNDSYRLESSFSPGHEPVAGSVYAYGQSYAQVAAVSVLADAGGDDEASLEAVDPGLEPTDPGPHQANSATARGAGYGFTGATAAVFTGPGRSTWTVRASTSGGTAGPAVAEGLAFGFVGTGILDDLGGNDAYLLEASSSAVRIDEPDPACGCPASAASASRPALISGQGGGTAGTGLLRDGGGDDTYVASSTSSAEARASDARTDGLATAAAAAEAADATATAQGAGIIGGAGFLLDLAGADRYESVTTSRAQASASAADPDGALAGSAKSGHAESRSQAGGAAGGYGELRDLAGADVYSSTNVTEAIASPATELKPGTATSSSQASVGDWPTLQGVGGAALFLDSDGGANDVFTTAPSDPACTGTRGTGSWMDCGQYAGMGTNR